MDATVQSESIYNKRILNFDEACQFTGFSKSYMRKLTAWNEIPFSKPHGKLLRFDREKLEAWLLSNPNMTQQEKQTAAVISTTILRKKKNS